MFAKHKNTQLDETVDSLQLILSDKSMPDDVRLKIADQLVTLHSTAKRDRVSSDTLATIAANIAGILIIVKYEQANVIASKALSFVQKLR